MDPATFIGLAIAFGAIFLAVILEGSSPLVIMLLPPILLVLGGTFGAAVAGGLLQDTLGLVHWVKVAFMSKNVAPDESVAILVSLAEKARREGLLALEDGIREVEDDFLKRGLELAVDGTDADELREILEAEVASKRAADKVGAGFFTAMGGYAPTVGIIGTVFGLIHVLENLSDPEKLGHLIAAAFVATLWGVLSANIIFLPMASKIKRISELECTRMTLIIEGVLAIQSGANPRLVAHKLRSLVPAKPGKAAAAEEAA